MQRPRNKEDRYAVKEVRMIIGIVSRHKRFMADLVVGYHGLTVGRYDHTVGHYDHTAGRYDHFVGGLFCLCSTF